MQAVPPGARPPDWSGSISAPKGSFDEIRNLDQTDKLVNLLMQLQGLLPVALGATLLPNTRLYHASGRKTPLTPYKADAALGTATRQYSYFAPDRWLAAKGILYKTEMPPNISRYKTTKPIEVLTANPTDLARSRLSPNMQEVLARIGKFDPHQAIPYTAERDVQRELIARNSPFRGMLISDETGNSLALDPQLLYNPQTNPNATGFRYVGGPRRMNKAEFELLSLNPAEFINRYYFPSRLQWK
jgi:hypothetical protein